MKTLVYEYSNTLSHRYEENICIIKDESGNICIGVQSPDDAAYITIPAEQVQKLIEALQV